MTEQDHLNYRVLGKGHPVVFLHGFLESTTMWAYLELEKAPFQSILIDLPGHGNSELSDNAEAPSILFMAEQVQKTLLKLGILSCDVVGHSMGGYIALELKRIDERCNKLVLLNSNFWEDNLEKKRDRVRVADVALTSKDLFIREAIPGLFYRHNRKDAVITDLIDEAKEMAAVGIAYASLAMRNRSDRSDILKKHQDDCLIIQGAHDPLISPERMKDELNDLPVKMEILPHSGHMAHIEQSDKVLELLVDFLT